MTGQEIFDALAARFGDAVSEFQPAAKDPWCLVAAEQLVAVCRALRDAPAWKFDYLQCLTGVDYPKESRIAVVYHLFSYEHRHTFVFKVMSDRADPVVPTVEGIWKTANWHERECYDLLGVVFEGHPDLRRILLPDDWVGHPLRKDWQEPDSYHGIPTTRPNPIELFQVSKKDRAAS
jgi:NADH-quinone oxidoreductase subunit C